MKTKTFISQVKNLPPIQEIVVAVLFILILLGSFPTGKGSVWPFYVGKTGTTYGINFALYTEYKPGADHFGIDLSLIRVQKEETSMNGLGISLAIIGARNLKNEQIPINIWPKINGLSVSLLSGGWKTSDQLYHNGLQIGIINQVTELNGFQFGIFNYDGDKAGFLLNFNF